MILLEVGDLTGLVFVLFAIMLVPPLVLFIIGQRIKKTRKKAAKVCFILATIYLIIGLGICGSII